MKTASMTWRCIIRTPAFSKTIVNFLNGRLKALYESFRFWAYLFWFNTGVLRQYNSFSKHSTKFPIDIARQQQRLRFTAHSLQHKMQGRGDVVEKECRGATAQTGFGAIFGAAKSWFQSRKFQIRSRLRQKDTFVAEHQIPNLEQLITKEVQTI